MTTRPKRTAAFALCGSFCSFSAVLPQIQVLTARGWEILPILSASAAGLDTRFGTAAALRQTLLELTGHEPLTTLQGVELRGAAQEPEIGDMVHFLQACGARILGCGTPVLTVDGGCPLTGTAHRPLPDRIAAATYAAALAAAGGEVEICGCDPAVYGAFLRFLAETGVSMTRAGDCVRLARDPAAPLRGGARLTADAWPAFATDTAPLAAAVLLTAAGESEIYDRLFANRFACAAGFAALGAGCTAQGRRLHIDGGAALHGAAVTAPDLRGGAALLIAALAAEGQTTLRDPGHIPRGYADLPGELHSLGADCTAARGEA